MSLAYWRFADVSPAEVYGVRCYKCGAQPGEWCRMRSVVMKGKPTFATYPHGDRVRLAGGITDAA